MNGYITRRIDPANFELPDLAKPEAAQFFEERSLEVPRTYRP
jgi:hypothetical protein